MSEHEKGEKKKSRDIFGIIGDSLHDKFEHQRGLAYQLWPVYTTIAVLGYIFYLIFF